MACFKVDRTRFGIFDSKAGHRCHYSWADWTQASLFRIQCSKFLGKCHPFGAGSNSQIRQGVADGVDDLHEAWMRLFEAFNRLAQPLERELQQLRILLRT